MCYFSHSGIARIKTRTQSFQYRRDFDTFKDFIEHYWSLKVKRAVQTIRYHAGPYRTIRDHTGPYRTKWDHTMRYKTIQTIQDNTGPYGTIWDQTGPYGTIFSQLSLSFFVCEFSISRVAHATKDWSCGHTHSSSIC